MQLTELVTPALLLDREAMERNIARMRSRLAPFGVALRPHVKTGKSIDVLRCIANGTPAGITVSTLKEAEYFVEHGVRDVLYAVGIAPGKLAHVAAQIRRGASLTIVLDNLEAARAVAEAAVAERVSFPVLIELDVDGHRSGVHPESGLLLELARALGSARGIELRGVLTHAGGSYNCRSVDEIAAMAERERAGAVHAAERIRSAGWPAPVVSTGSTPTATFARDFTGVTEVRVGVFVFQDLYMAGLGVCVLEDIALSVLVTVIGHQPGKGWIITDGGWMALSRDRGTAQQSIDQGYGVVRDVRGRAPVDDLIVQTTNQEHGIVARRDGAQLDPARYPVGTLLRILPNHACATAAQHSSYRVVDARSTTVVDTWSRIAGW